MDWIDSQEYLLFKLLREAAFLFIRNMAKYIVDTEKVERLMLNRDMTVKALLSAAEMSPMTWWRVMRDQQPTGLCNVAVLAYALDVHPKDLIFKKIEEPKKEKTKKKAEKDRQPPTA